MQFVYYTVIEAQYLNVIPTRCDVSVLQKVTQRQFVFMM